MNLINDLLEKPSSLTTASRYTAFNGVVYLIAGATLIIWPGVLQTLFGEEAFVGHEGALMRVIGLTIVVIGCSMCSAAAPAHGRSSPPP